MLERLGVNWREASIDDVRLAYLDHLRGVAAGRLGDDGLDLASERAMTERVNREIRILELAEKRGELVAVDQLEAHYGQMVDAFKSDLLALPDKIAGDVRTLHGIDIDVELINGLIYSTLEQLSGYDPDGQPDSEAPGEALGAAGENEVDTVVAALSAPVGEGFGVSGEIQP